MAEYTAASVALADVQAKCNLATADGDTVFIPAGSANWTGKLTWSNNGGKLIGAGSTSITGGNDVTVITDNYNANDRLMDLGGLSEIAGFTLQTGTATTEKDPGWLAIGGTTDVKIHHCRFHTVTDAGYHLIYVGSGVRGVMYECIVYMEQDNLLPSLYVANGRFGGGGDAQGNYEWTQPTAFGTDDFFYIEDCTFETPNAGPRIWDGFTAAKVVVRFCDMLNGGLSETHATGHSPDDRGTRAQEVYGNHVTSDRQLSGPSFCAIEFGSGCGLAWGNSWGDSYKHLFVLNVTRKEGAPACGGSGTYCQTATPNGWGYAGTAFTGTGSNWDGGTFNGTDTTLGYPCLDMPGRGAGDLLVGNMPSKTNQTTGTIAWPNQALEPIYWWANIGTFMAGWGGSTISNNTSGRAVSDRDYYVQASGVQVSASSPFNGTTGTGWGTLANRPTTCTTGVAYWATDQGDWNQSDSNPYGVNQNGNSGVLYKATATNTWTLYYEPYTYPHPLRNESADTIELNVTTANITNLTVG